MSRPRKKPTIAQAFGVWLGWLNEAHRQGLVDDCHELARIAEGLRQMAQCFCDRDPDWSHCFEGSEFDQAAFNSMWRDIQCDSSAGRVDELLRIQSVYSKGRRAKAKAKLRQ